MFQKFVTAFEQDDLLNDALAALALCVTLIGVLFLPALV